MTYLSKHFAEYLARMTPLCLYSFLTFTFRLMSQKIYGGTDFNWDNGFNNSAPIFYAPRCTAIVMWWILNDNAAIIDSNDRLKWIPQSKTESFLSTYERTIKEFRTLEHWADISENTTSKLVVQNLFPGDREWSQQMLQSSVWCCPR